MLHRPFRASADYIEWAHGSAAGDGNRLALRLTSATVYGDTKAAFHLFNAPELVAEIADVAELYIGGRDSDLRAASVRSRAMKWLRLRGLSKKALLTEFATARGDRDGANTWPASAESPSTKEI